MFCHKWKELTLFQADAQYKALEGKHTPNKQIQRVNSTHRTVYQRHTNCVSLRAPFQDTDGKGTFTAELSTLQGSPSHPPPKKKKKKKKRRKKLNCSVLQCESVCSAKVKNILLF